MITLAGFPFRNQLADIAGKNAPGAARYENCVPTSLAACVQWYDGVKVSAEDLRVDVYGTGYNGGTDELKFGPYLKAHYNLNLLYYPEPSASQAIIDNIRKWLRVNTPVIVTMHSQWSRLWNADGGDGYHVGVAYSIDESDNGNLHIMNPWGGFDHVQPVAWWRERLGIGVWPVARLAAALPSGWHDDGTTLTCANGVPVVHGFREYVLAKLQSGGWQGGDAYSAEWGDANSSRQLFAATLLEWTPQGGVVEGSMADALALAEHLREGKAA